MNPLTDPLRAAAQRLFDAALDSGFPTDEIDPESSYAQAVTVPLRGRDLDALRAALAAEARPRLDVVLSVLSDVPHDDQHPCTACRRDGALAAAHLIEDQP